MIPSKNDFIHQINLIKKYERENQKEEIDEKRELLKNRINRLIYEITADYSISEIFNYSAEKISNTHSKKTFSRIADTLINEKIKRVMCSENKNHEGYFYEVMNKNGCISYLLGTNHGMELGSLINSITNILSQSIELITEVGEEALCDKDFSESMDPKITKIAKQHGIKISAFESDAEQKKLMSELDFSTLNPATSYDRLVSAYVAEAWRNADKEMCEKFWTQEVAYFTKEIQDRLYNQRHKKWLNDPSINLVHKLKTTNKPICVAVGYCHYLGQESLIASLEKEGLNVSAVAYRDLRKDKSPLSEPKKMPTLNETFIPQ